MLGLDPLRCDVDKEGVVMRPREELMDRNGPSKYDEPMNNAQVLGVSASIWLDVEIGMVLAGGNEPKNRVLHLS